MFIVKNKHQTVYNFVFNYSLDKQKIFFSRGMFHKLRGIPTKSLNHTLGICNIA